MNIKYRHGNTGDTQFVLFFVHRHAVLADFCQFVIHRAQFGDGIAGQRLDLILVAFPVARHIRLLTKRHVDLAHRRAVERHMLTDISTRAQHTGCRLKLINQNSVVVFPAGEVHRLAGSNVQRFKVWRRHVDNIQ